MSVKVKKIERKKMPLLERIYIFYIIAGMARTFKHFIRNLLNTKNIPSKNPMISALDIVVFID